MNTYIKDIEQDIDISVIITAYNIEKYVGRAIKSAAFQAGVNVEVIVIDDGSTDKTLDIISNIAQIYPRIKCIRQENKGNWGAKISGIKYCNGRYISWLDGDDYLENDIYFKLINDFIRDEIDVLEFGYRSIDAEGREVGNKLLKQEVLNNHDAIKALFNRRNTSVSVCNKLYKAELFKNVQFTEKIKSHEEDLLMNIKLMLNANIISRCPIVGYNYFMRDNSTTHQDFEDKYNECICTWQYIYKLIKNRMPEMMALAGVNYCSRMALTYCIEKKHKQSNAICKKMLLSFNKVYNDNLLDDYKYVDESYQRKYLVRLFRFSPTLCYHAFWLIRNWR